MDIPKGHLESGLSSVRQGLATKESWLYLHWEFFVYAGKDTTAHGLHHQYRTQQNNGPSQAKDDQVKFLAL